MVINSRLSIVTNFKSFRLRLSVQYLNFLIRICPGTALADKFLRKDIVLTSTWPVVLRKWRNLGWASEEGNQWIKEEVKSDRPFTLTTFWAFKICNIKKETVKERIDVNFVRNNFNKMYFINWIKEEVQNWDEVLASSINMNYSFDFSSTAAQRSLRKNLSKQTEKAWLVPSR